MNIDLTPHFAPRLMAPLGFLSGFAVSGADAISFLHNQLTNDVKQLLALHAQRTGLCTAKGRLLAVMLQWKTEDQQVVHLLPAELKAPITKRLKMFVLRAQAQFSADDSPVQALGLWGKASSNLGLHEVRRLNEQLFLIRVEDCPVLGHRALLVGLGDHASMVGDLYAKTAASDCVRAIDASAWRFSDIQAGQSWVWAATQESFVPQMINLELTNGVSFTKGCYPGQEVVARSQYLGKLKRRTFLVAMDRFEPGMTPGLEVWSGMDPSQPVGQVVDAVQSFNPDGSVGLGGMALIEVTTDAWASQDLRIASLQGDRLSARQLPYPFPAAA